MKTKPSDILAAIFLAPVALIFGVLLAAVIIPFFAVIGLLMAAVLPFVMVDSAVCHALGWPDWSERQRRKKLARERPEHVGCDCSGIPVPPLGCCLPPMPSHVPLTSVPAVYCPPICKTCLARAKQIPYGDVRSLGNAWCQECGAEYEVIA